MGTGRPKARPHSGGGGYGGGKGQAEREDGHTRSQKGGKKGIYPLVGHGGEGEGGEGEGEARQRMPSLQSGTESALVGWPGTGTETRPQGTGTLKGRQTQNAPHSTRPKWLRDRAGNACV